MNQSNIPPAIIRQSLFILLLTGLGIVLFTFLRAFLSGLLGALVLYILLRPLFFYLTETKKINKTLSILISLTITVLIFVIPVWIVTAMLAEKAGYAVENYEKVLNAVREVLQSASAYVGINILSEETIGKISGMAAEVIPSLVSATLSTLTQFAVMFFVLYFMLADARTFEKWAKSFSPFGEDTTRTLLQELKSMTISNSLGIPILGIIQAIFAGLGYWILGVESPFMWAVLTGLFSVVPVVGTTIIWIPLGIYLYATGHPLQAGLLIAFGAVVITNIDNIFRFVVQKQIADIHPLITFFGVFLGIDLFGFTGIIFGPLLISYFLILLKLYKKEYAS